MNSYQKWLSGDGCSCANNFIHIETADCKKQDVCDCENILLELSKQHTDDLTLQDEIDYVSGITDTKLDESAYTPVDLSEYYTKSEVDNIADTKLDASAYTPTDLSDYYTKEQVDALIPEVPSLSGYATEQWVLDKHYITGVDLSDYATKDEIPVIPTNVSAFINDAGYVTNSELIQYITNLQEQINSLVSSISGCCGESGETLYRWVTMTGENDYWCSGTTKMSKEKQQSSSDGINWTDTGTIRSGSTILEENCIACGYVPISGDNKYFATTIMGTTISGACCDDPETYDPPTCDELNLHEIAANTGQLRTIDIGNCTKVVGNGVLAGEYNLTSVVVPSSVTHIKGVMLEGCTAIQRLTINRETPPQFYQMPGSSGVGLFDADPETETIPVGFKIYVPASAVNTYKAAETWSRYSSIIQAI